MNTSEMRANENALREEKVTAAKTLKFGLIRTLTLTSIFSMTIIDRAKRFSTIKTTFQDEQVEGFSRHSQN